MTSDSEITSSQTSATRAVILYRRNVPVDDEVLNLLETELPQHGCDIFIDRQMKLGLEWARAVEEQIRGADAVIPLLSEASMHSELVAFQVETAYDLAQQQSGRPCLVPLCVQFSEELPQPFSGLLGSCERFTWNGPEDNQRVIRELVEKLGHLPTGEMPAAFVPHKAFQLIASRKEDPPILASPVPPPSIEPVGMPVPVDSAQYVERASDRELETALRRGDSIVLIKGARQMGRTSMILRSLRRASQESVRVALTSLQKLTSTHLETVDALYFSLADSLAQQLKLPARPADVWDENRGGNVNFERYLCRHVLTDSSPHFVWALDEVDRLFSTAYGSEVFGLFRSWHNERALEPESHWNRLTLVLAYATEAHLFITDLNQSPFNVGTRLVLEDFSTDQILELNRRMGEPLKKKSDLERFIGWVGGHPFLVRRGLHELASKGLDLAALETQAIEDEGPFGDHLSRMLFLLGKDPDLTEKVRSILRGKANLSPEAFYRLRSAGVIMGDAQDQAKPRCQLYAKYLARHLLEP